MNHAFLCKSSQFLIKPTSLSWIFDDDDFDISTYSKLRDLRIRISYNCFYFTLISEESCYFSFLYIFICYCVLLIVYIKGDDTDW